MVITALEKGMPGDIDEIAAIIRHTVAHLNQTGIPQWDERYPTVSDVREDIKNEALYVTRFEGRIAGVITLNQTYDPEYVNGTWRYEGPDFAVVHRLIVSPNMQGRGIGTRIMLMAEEMLRAQGVRSVRLDAFSQNPYSLRLYDKLGYRIVGEAAWRMGLFYLMEKDITAAE